jgi:hypothetical protein
MTDVTATIARLWSVSQLDLKEWRYREGLEPVALAADFDDSAWAVDSEIHRGRGTGSVMGWFRRVVEIPERIAGFPVAGSRAALVANVDDYGEIWVDGAYRSPIAGFNKEQEALLSEQGQPGDRFVVAILAVNGPIARPIGGIFVRYARVRFSGLESVQTAADGLIGELQRLHRMLTRTPDGLPALAGKLAQATELIDWAAADSGDKAGFIGSLQKARRELS